MVTAAMLGAFLVQYPVGLLADLIDKRVLLFILTLIAAGISFLCTFVFQGYSAATLCLMLILGAATNVIYPVSMAYALTHVKSEDIVNVTQGLMISYGLGSLIGPSAVAVLIDWFGAAGFFLGLLLFSAIFLAAIVAIRFLVTNPAKFDHQYSVVPGTTPIAAELDPRAEVSES